MNPLDHLIQLAKGGNEGAVASLQQLAKSGNADATTALSTLNADADEALDKGLFDADDLRKGLADLHAELGGADEGADLSKGQGAEDGEGDDLDEDNLEFDFVDEGGDVAKSLAEMGSRLERLTKGVVGSGYGVLSVGEELSKGMATMARVETKLDTLLKALKRPVAPAGVVQRGQKPAGKPIAGLAKGAPDPGTLKKSLQAKAESAQPGTAAWSSAMDALDALSVGNTQPAVALLNAASN